MQQLTLESAAFPHEGPIPSMYTCDGKDISPPLSWSGVPPGARSLALIVEDPDAPDPAAPTTTWTHWIVFDIPPTATGLPEAVYAEALPVGAVQGRNSWDRRSYGGPCPPVGRHRYYFKLYALDAVLTSVAPDAAELYEAMGGHVLAEGLLMGTYERQSK